VQCALCNSVHFHDLQAPSLTSFVWHVVPLLPTQVQLGIPVPKFWGLLMAKLIGSKSADKLLLTGKLVSPPEVGCAQAERDLRSAQFGAGEQLAALYLLLYFNTHHAACSAMHAPVHTHTHTYTHTQAHTLTHTPHTHIHTHAHTHTHHSHAHARTHTHTPGKFIIPYGIPHI